MAVAVTMVDDNKVSSDISLLADLNEDLSTPFNSIEFDSNFYDLLNLEDGRDTPNLFPERDPFLVESVDGSKQQDNPHLVVETESPKVYIAPRIMINHQDSFSLDSRIDSIEDARIFSDSPREIKEFDLSPRVRVPGSQREIKEFDLSPRLRVPGSPREIKEFDLSPRLRLPDSPKEIKELGLSPRPRVPSSPRDFVHPSGPVLIDTAAPFESVKEAVSKFGGITDWKARKIQTIERQKTVDQELERIQENIPEYKKQAFVAEEEKQQVVVELESTRSVIEELKLELEKAEIEEQQAKRDSDLAKLRVEEMEQGVDNEASLAAKSQLEVAKARHLSAVSELGNVREEIGIVTNEYESLLREKDLAAKKADASVLKAKELKKQMEGLAIEVIATKELLESAQVAHLKAEEKKFDATMARDQDIYNREKALRMVEEEIERLRQEIQAADNVKTKLETASALQQNLRAEIAAFKVSNDNMLMGKRNKSDIQTAVDSARKELEEVKSNIEKANSEMKTLTIIVGSLQSGLEREKKDLSETKQREALSIQRNSAEAREERCIEIAKKLQEAEREAEEAKSLAFAVQEELRKAKEESDQAKTGVSRIERELMEAKKEMEAARASEKLALAAIKALQETEYANRVEDISSSPRSIVVSVEEYYQLSKQAHEVEEAANRKLAEIVSRIEEAKEEESRILEKLEEVNRETASRKEELKEAMGKVEKARDANIGMDHELRKWSSENYELGKPKSALQKPRSFAFGEQGSSSNVTTETKKKKKMFSLIPKVFMFLSKKKSNK